LAARTHSYTATASNGGRSNHRATLAVLCGIVAVLAVPLAIWLTRRVTGAVLLDAVWAIPVAAVAAVTSLMLARGGRGDVNQSGPRRLLAARVLAVTGICLALSSALAVGIYEFLVWKETH
jgi:steroid 5-alpha reductase family enzyme